MLPISSPPQVAPFVLTVAILLVCKIRQEPIRRFKVLAKEETANKNRKKRADVVNELYFPLAGGIIIKTR